jgi:beta-N-acetylhexosaminidase
MGRQFIKMLGMIVVGMGLFPALAPGQAPAMVSHEEAAKWAEQTLSALSLEKKIGQLICAEIAGGYITPGDPRFEQWVRLARDKGVGMFVLYGGTPRDVARLLNRLQKEAALPILMAADFEGGPGQQVTGASEFPANMAFAAAGSEELMYEAARVGGIEGRAMGIHLTYSPAVDIAVRPDNPAESVRSFGGDLDLLGRMVRAYVRGYRDGGMLTTAKHFPGRGDVERQPAFPDFTYINKPADQVEAQDFRAFKEAVDAGVTFIMTEHIAVPSAAEGSELTASVERKLATGWVRDRLGFKGILTTDDLWYDQVVKRFGDVDVAVKALQAGHDMILKPKDIAATIERIAAAVRSGEVSQTHIDQAVSKLLYWKARLNLHKSRMVDENLVDRSVGTTEHMALVQRVADQSLTLLSNDGVLPLSAVRPAKIVNISVQKLEADPAPAALAAKLAAAFPGTQSFTLRPDMDSAYYESILPAVSSADLVVLSLFVQRNRLGDAAPLREADIAFINKVVAAKPKAVVAMSYGNPQLIRRIESVPAFLVGYGEKGWFGNQNVYFDSFVKLLKGEIKPRGKLPVKVSDRFPLGSGLTY